MVISAIVQPDHESRRGKSVTSVRLVSRSKTSAFTDFGGHRLVLQRSHINDS